MRAGRDSARLIRFALARHLGALGRAILTIRRFFFLAALAFLIAALLRVGLSLQRLVANRNVTMITCARWEDPTANDLVRDAPQQEALEKAWQDDDSRNTGQLHSAAPCCRGGT